MKLGPDYNYFVEEVSLPPVSCLWPLDSQFHGLELTEKCQHADLIDVYFPVNDTCDYVPLNGQNGETLKLLVSFSDLSSKSVVKLRPIVS